MTKCILCTAVVDSGQKFYDHLEDVHMMPIRRQRINEQGLPQEESHRECMERFKYNHPEFGTDICWCPDCVGGEALMRISEICAKHGQLYIQHKGRYK